MDFHLILSKVKCDIRNMQEVVAEVFFDYEPFVAEANDEVIDGVIFHRISVRESKSVLSLWRAVRKKVNHILNMII